VIVFCLVDASIGFSTGKYVKCMHALLLLHVVAKSVNVIKSAGERSEKVELKTWQGQILKKKCLMSIWSCVSGHFTGNLIGSVSSWITFVCLFVCWNKTRKNYTPPPIGREVNPLGVVTDGQRHKPRRAYQRQRHKLRTCQSIVSFSSVQSHLFASQHFFFFRV